MISDFQYLQVERQEKEGLISVVWENLATCRLTTKKRSEELKKIQDKLMNYDDWNSKIIASQELLQKLKKKKKKILKEIQVSIDCAKVKNKMFSRKIMEYEEEKKIVTDSAKKNQTLTDEIERVEKSNDKLKDLISILNSELENVSNLINPSLEDEIYKITSDTSSIILINDKLTEKIAQMQLQLKELQDTYNFIESCYESEKKIVSQFVLVTNNSSSLISKTGELYETYQKSHPDFIRLY